MKFNFIILILILSCPACFPDEEPSPEPQQKEQSAPAVFDKEKWLIKAGKDYPFRDAMLHDLVYNDTVRSLKKVEIITLLGKPDKANEGYLYYTVSQKRLGSWPLHTKTLVIKFRDENTIEWIKIHK